MVSITRNILDFTSFQYETGQGWILCHRPTTFFFHLKHNIKRCCIFNIISMKCGKYNIELVGFYITTVRDKSRLCFIPRNTEISINLTQNEKRNLIYSISLKNGKCISWDILDFTFLQYKTGQATLKFI